MNGISLFRRLDERLTKQIGITRVKKIECTYQLNGEIKAFNYDESGDSVSLDALGWNKETDAITISASYKIANPDFLFGANGVACGDARIGLAILWKSKDSRQRGSIKIGSFSKGEGKTLFSLTNHTFEPHQFRGRLLLETVIYLDSAGTQSEEEHHLTNTPGSILGDPIEKVNLYFDGDGSTFQYYETSTPGGPLWNVICDFEDPLTENFHDSVSIEINKSNPAFKYIDPSSIDFNPEMLKEILAEQMCIILLTIRDKAADQWQNIIAGIADKDSVGDVARSLMNSGIDLSSPSACSESVRRYIIGENLEC